MGRFLFPAFPAFAVLVIGGLSRWPLLWGRPTATAAGVAVGMAGLALLALVGYLAPAVRYPPPANLDAAGQPVEAQLGDVARVLALDVRPEMVHPGQPVYVSVVWEPLKQTTMPYNVFVHVIDEEGVLIAQRDTWPGLGRAPTNVWEPNRAFVDTYRVDVPQTAYAPDQAVVRVGLDAPGKGRLPVMGPESELLGDSIQVDAVAIDPNPGPWPNTQAVNFGDQITLVGYSLEPRALSAGETFTLTLFWQPSEPDHDYAVFAQVIDSSWNVWGSKDGGGLDWGADPVVRDVRRVTLLPDTPPGSYPLQVGLFHRETGRLPVIAPQGHYIDERVILGPVRVKE
jgi:hypothetical protein